jgi:hypothetical protein
VNADSCIKCSRSKQSEMKTAGHRLCGLLCAEIVEHVWNSDSAIGMSVIKTGFNVSCC